MSPLAAMLLLTALAGLAMPAGAMLARVDRLIPSWLQQEFRHTVIAFGGGVLLAAVALVLVPRGAGVLPWYWAAPLFLAGGVCFLGLDRALSASRASAAQLVAMLADFIPEALALGAAFATGEPTGVLLALLIALQNLPEGFNAYRELRSSTRQPGRPILPAFLAMATLGPISGLAGFYWLAGMPRTVGGVMLFAAGGILYLTFEDIAPQAKITSRDAPALGAVLGFLLGLIGDMLLHNHG